MEKFHINNYYNKNDELSIPKGYRICLECFEYICKTDKCDICRKNKKSTDLDFQTALNNFENNDFKSKKEIVKVIDFKSENNDFYTKRYSHTVSFMSGNQRYRIIIPTKIPVSLAKDCIKVIKLVGSNIDKKDIKDFIKRTRQYFIPQMITLKSFKVGSKEYKNYYVGLRRKINYFLDPKFKFNDMNINRNRMNNIKNNSHINMRIPKDMDSYIRQIAKDKKLTKAQFVRDCINFYLKENNYLK